MECVNLLFLILLSSLSHTVRAEKKVLDMAPDAVDDVFSGCRDRMLKAVTEPDGLLQKELKTTMKRDAEMWNKNKTCKKQIQGLTSFHQTALEFYANSKTGTRKMFNNMVYASGSNATTYKNDFPFKALHFLLTDTLNHLNNNKTCSTVFYGTNNVYTAKTGAEIRFGKFFRSGRKKNPEEEKILSEGEGTLFEIHSCSVVDVENYTCSSEEVDLLIAPTEVFTVMKVEVLTNDAEYNIITLNHSGFLSNHDCYLYDSISEATTPSSRDNTQAPGGSSSPLLSSMVLALVASVLSFYYCSAL